MLPFSWSAMEPLSVLCRVGSGLEGGFRAVPDGILAGDAEARAGIGEGVEIYPAAPADANQLDDRQALPGNDHPLAGFNGGDQFGKP